MADTTYTIVTYDAAGNEVDRRTVTRSTDAVNADTLRERAVAAMATNRTDITQADAIRTQADTLANTTGTFANNGVRDGHIRDLARAVRLLADHDIATKQQVNGIIHLLLGDFTRTD